MNRYGLRKLLVAVILGCASQVMAQTPPVNPPVECLTPQQISAIAVDFKQFASFAKSKFCDDQSKNFIMLQTLNKLKTIQFEAATPASNDELYKKRFQGIITSWYGYFTQRIKTIEMNPSRCVAGDNILAYVMSFGGPQMYACPDFFDKRLLPLERVETLLHEARHKDGFSHITCTRGSRAGIPGACDQKISDKGSYAVSVESLSQISKYAKDLNPTLRLYLAGSALQITDAFQEEVKVDANDFILIKTVQNKILSLNLSNLVLSSIPGSLPAGKLIFKDEFTAVLPEDRKLNPTLFSNVKLVSIDSPSATLDLFKKSDIDERLKWVDINYGKALSIIKKNQVDFICDKKKLDNRQTVLLPANDEALAMLYPDNPSDVTKTKDVLQLKSGALVLLSCDKDNKAKIEKSAMKFDNTYSRIYNVKGQVIGLGLDNRLYKINGAKSELIASTSQLQISDIVPRKSYLFFE